MMHTILRGFLLTFLCPLLLWGQAPYLNLKFVPLAALEPVYHTLELGLEYRLSPHWGIEASAGYGNHYLNPWAELTSSSSSPDSESEAYRTWRYRLEGRYYFNPNDRDEIYLAFNLNYKDSRFLQSGFIGENCDAAGNCDFFRFGRGFIDKDLLSLHLKFGWQAFLGKRFMVDVFGGLGARGLWVSSPTLREDRFFFEEEDGFGDFIDRRSPGQTWYPSLSAGIKFAYLFHLAKNDF